ncbi:hypothetical protein HaLaN_14150 [Haematococcus lacustris]|uniref:Uncharacterized protein n=1 Tax=Haematococcus lacustris TaxID=44745 RepID=A0A699ZF37_HAELA|nr:hypothetical protein HaLaN_14150 [Haematococcus lacustris]
MGCPVVKGVCPRNECHRSGVGSHQGCDRGCYNIFVGLAGLSSRVRPRMLLCECSRARLPTVNHSTWRGALVASSEPCGTARPHGLRGQAPALGLEPTP